MADTDDTDISGMPTPPAELVNSAAPDVSGMPSPADVFKQHVGRDPESDTEVQNFLHYPENWGHPELNPAYEQWEAKGVEHAKKVAKVAEEHPMTFLPGMAENALGAVTAGVGSLADVVTGSESGAHDWAYQPRTEAGQQIAQLTGEETANLGSAYDQAFGTGPAATEIKTRIPEAMGAIGTVVPILRGAEALHGRLTGSSTARPSASSGDLPSATPPAPAPAPTEATPAVEGPVRGADLRAQPDPLAEAQPVSPQPETRSVPVAGKPHIRLKAQATQPAPAASEAAPVNVAPETQTAPAPSNAAPGAQAGIRFTPPSAEGATAGAASADVQAGRLDTLRNLNRLGNGQLDEVRSSAVSGDTKETGTDYQHAQINDTGGDRMQGVIANETNTLRDAAENLTNKTGTASIGVDQTALRERGTVIDRALQGIKSWFDNSDPNNPGAVQRVYAQANANAAGRPIERFTRTADILGDQTNFMGTAEGEALYRGALARAQRLGLVGQDGAWRPATVEQAERFRQWLGDNYTPRTARMIYQLRNALDGDVAAHGGQNLYDAARNLRQRQSQMLEDPKGISDALDRDGINRKVQIEQLPDHIANLPTDQFNHVINVLKSAAHLGNGELAEPAAAAIREIKGHMASRIQQAGSAKIQGGWDAKGVYQQLDKYSQKMPAVFGPKEMQEWKTLNDASNVLRMDRRYPGAGAQIHNTGIAAGIRAQAGKGIRAAVDVAAHHALPMVGPVITEGSGLSEKLGRIVGGNPEAKAVAARLAEVESRITKLNPGDMPPTDESGQIASGRSQVGVNPPRSQRGGPKYEGKPSGLLTDAERKAQIAERRDYMIMRAKQPAFTTLEHNASGESSASLEAQNRVAQEKAAGKHRFQIDPDGNVTPLTGVDAVDAKAPQGHLIVQRGIGNQPYTILDRGGLPQAGANGLLARAHGLGNIREAELAQIRGPKNQVGAIGNLNPKKVSAVPLEGAPEGDRPNPVARGAAAAYAKSAGIKDYQPLTNYRYVPPEVAEKVANAYDAMEHAPNDPKVKAAYDAFKQETKAQWDAIKKTGLEVDFKQPYPYGANPREAIEDIRNNNHMTVFPTDVGFGTEGMPNAHPMLEKSGVKFDGKEVTYNDLFRIVHDYFGHAAEGNGFRANGEYNAWRAHRTLYSDAAKPAMDSETLGQNSWVNYGPKAVANAGASQTDTAYADQKAGLLPKGLVKTAQNGMSAKEYKMKKASK